MPLEAPVTSARRSGVSPMEVPHLKYYLRSLLGLTLELVEDLLQRPDDLARLDLRALELQVEGEGSSLGLEAVDEVARTPASATRPLLSGQSSSLDPRRALTSEPLRESGHFLG